MSSYTENHNIISNNLPISVSNIDTFVVSIESSPQRITCMENLAPVEELVTPIFGRITSLPVEDEPENLPIEYEPESPPPSPPRLERMMSLAPVEESMEGSVTPLSPHPICITSLSSVEEQV